MSLVGAPARAALDYEAPFLIEKLVKDRVVETPAEARSLFLEVKRYLVLAASDDRRGWHMYSLRIDECWHQFILFTQQYIEFCQRYFGRYLPHSPSNAPMAGPASDGSATTFEEFVDRYRALFGIALPDDWYDERNVTVNRRVLNDRAGWVVVREQAGSVELATPHGEVLVAVNDLAAQALAFVARTGAFYVRELPGGQFRRLGGEQWISQRR